MENTLEKALETLQSALVSPEEKEALEFIQAKLGSAQRASVKILNHPQQKAFNLVGPSGCPIGQEPGLVSPLGQPLSQQQQEVEVLEMIPVGGGEAVALNGTKIAAAIEAHGDAINILTENIGGTAEEVLENIMQVFSTFDVLCGIFGIGEEAAPEGSLH